MVQYTESNNILPHTQFGFHRELSTLHPLIHIRNIVNTNFDYQKSTGMILLHIKDAFDSVNEGLIYKLIKLKFPDYIIKIVQSFLDGRVFKIHKGLTYPEYQQGVLKALVCPLCSIIYTPLISHS